MFRGSLFFYFLPAIVAGSRHHRNGAAIFCLNLFLGWSLIGWVVALCWALTNQQPPTYSVAVAGGSLPPAAPQHAEVNSRLRNFFGSRPIVLTTIGAIGLQLVALLFSWPSVRYDLRPARLHRPANISTLGLRGSTVDSMWRITRSNPSESLLEH